MNKLLIANRGEIAIRIRQSAAEAGLTTVAIFPEDDAQSLHVRSADESIEIPGTGASAYLDTKEIIIKEDREYLQANVSHRRGRGAAAHPLLVLTALLSRACKNRPLENRPHRGQK